MLTLSHSTTDTFPFKIHDRVLIQWNCKAHEEAVVHFIHSSIQGGKQVVHAVMCKTETNPKPFVVCHSLIKKI